MKQIDFPRYFLSPLRRGSAFYLGFWGVMGMFAPFVNVYFRQVLGFNGRQIGILSIFFPLMTLVIAMPVSALADRRSWRVRILTIVVAGFGLMLMLAGIPQTFLVWIVLMFVIALFFGPILPLADSLIARMAIRHDLNYGSMRLWGSFSFAVAAVICGILWEHAGFGSMFLIAGLSFFPVSLCAFTLEEVPVSPEQQRRPSFWEIRKDTGLMVLVGTSFLVGASIHLAVIFDGIYMNSLGGTQALVGLMFGVSAFCELPTMHYSMVIARYLGGAKTLLSGYGLLISAFLGYTLVHHPWLLIPMGMLKGLGFGLFYVNTVRMTNERAPESWASTIQSIVLASAFGLAPLIASPLGGEIYDRFGIKYIYVFTGLLITVSALILITSIVRGVFSDTTLNSSATGNEERKMCFAKKLS